MQEQVVPPKRGDDKYYAVRGKKGEPSEELLDLITYYNYLHQQSGKTMHTAYISIVDIISHYYETASSILNLY